MKRPKYPSRTQEQLEFEDLIAETVDICLRMRSIRRKDLIFCPLRIPGWHTSESLRFHFTPPRFDEAWLDSAFHQIKNAGSVRDSLIVTASHLSEILDQERERTRQGGSDTTKYSEYCEELIQLIPPGRSEEAQLTIFCLKAAQVILDVYDESHALNEWEILERLESELTLGGALEEALEGKAAHLFGIFAGCLGYLYGWLAEDDQLSASASRE
jgi:hypothetical protein